MLDRRMGATSPEMLKSDRPCLRKGPSCDERGEYQSPVNGSWRNISITLKMVRPEILSVIAFTAVDIAPTAGVNHPRALA